MKYKISIILTKFKQLFMQGTAAVFGVSSFRVTGRYVLHDPVRTNWTEDIIPISKSWRTSDYKE